MAVVTSVKINQGHLQQLIKTKIYSGDGGKINAQAFKAIGELSDAMIGTSAHSPTSTIAGAIKVAAVQEMASGLNAVSASLKAGFPGAQTGSPGRDWPRLSESWLNRKRASSKDLFWKDTGALTLGFNNFRQNYIRTLESTKTTVKSRARRNTFGKKAFSYEITLDLPGHREGFITQLTRDSFVKGTPFTGMGYSSQFLGRGERPKTFAKIGLLEGVGKTHRPFIAKLMADRGQIYQSHLHQIIQSAVNKSGKLKL